MKYEILHKSTLYDGFLKLSRIKARYARLDDSENKSLESTFEIMEKNPASAVLLYERESDEIMLVRQFRAACAGQDDPFILEIVAGGVDFGEDPREAASRETLEEAGYTISHLEPIASFYASPGVTNEKMYLYFAEVSQDMKAEKGGGLKSEGEDLQLVRIPVERLSESLLQIHDAKTLIAIQWFILNKMNS